ncbi:GPW/gp25 family protein [Myxococcota bacterium]|nr:GPW/gp25 family protein [Myxococcota bacterium]HOU52938.1 GPW/gp25 family protein [Myxococcota bacterium]HQK51795.1 GPW/gp25 family protein [Myxococcota bacterium]
MKKDFLGRGFAFPMRLDPKGSVALSEGEQNIEECIRLLLGTAPGERPMRPDFGCRIHDFVFYPNNANTASLVAYYVREALAKWEPRIEDIRVSATPDPVQENAIRVDIRYRIRRSNNTRNLVYPFYLRREQDL